MAVLKTEKHFIIKLTFAKKADGSLREIYVSERSCPADYLYSGSPDILGILGSTAGFGQSMGEIVSKNHSGTIALKSVIGTLAFNQRVIDLLEEYVIVNQDIRGWSFEKSTGQQGDIADLAPEFVGKVAKTKIDPISQLFIIEVDSNDFSTAIVNNRIAGIEEQLLAHPDYLTTFDFKMEKSGQNNYAPIVFGKKKEVVTNRLSLILTPNDNNIYYASQVILSGQTKLPPLNIYDNVENYEGGLLIVWGSKQDSNGEYKRIPFIDSGYSIFTGAGISAGDIAPYDVTTNEVRIFYIPMNFPGLTGRMNVHSITLRTTSTISASWNGEVEIQVCTGTISSENQLAFTEISGANGKSAKKDYQGSILLDINLNSSFVLEDDVTYYLRVKETGISSTIDVVNCRFPYVAGADAIYYEVENSEDKSMVLAGFAIGGLRLTELFGTGLAKTLNPPLVSFDLFNTIELYNRKSSNPYAKNYALNTNTDIDSGLILELDGISDDDAGTITGNPIVGPDFYTKEILERTYHILKALYFLQNNNSLVGWDSTRFPDAETRSVLVGGIEYDVKTYRQMMLEICEAGSGALIKNRDGSVSFWTYTCEQTPVDIITERDCVLDNIESLGVESIVNSISLAYNKKETPLSASAKEQSYFGNLLVKTDADSQGIYGVLEPDQIFQENVWIDNFDAAERYTDYKIQQQAFERYEFTIVVPYWKNRYRFHELWDLVWLSHIELPSRYGALPPNKTKPLGEGVDWAIGDVLRQAKSYLCRIVDRQQVLTDGKETGLRFVLRTIGEKEQF